MYVLIRGMDLKAFVSAALIYSMCVKLQPTSLCRTHRKGRLLTSKGVHRVVCPAHSTDLSEQL